MDFIEIASAGNAVDFGDMTSVQYSASYGSQVSGMWGGGRTPASTNTTTIQKINFGSLGNTTDFGNLRTARGGPGDATSNRTKGIYASGENPSGTTWLDEIETESLTTAGTGVDFGDLSRAKSAIVAVSQAHGGLAENFPRAPELYSPTSKIFLTGPNGDIGIFGGGHNPTRTENIDFTTISSLGNTLDFGDMVESSRVAVQGQVSSNIRTIFGSIRTPSITNRLEYIEFRTKGNGSDFGDIATATGDRGGCSNSTRGIFAGGYAPSVIDVIEYITLASVGNSTDFGS